MRDNKNHVQRPGVLCPLSLWGGKWQMLMNLPLLFNPYLFFTLIRMHFLGTILLWEYLEWLFGMFFFCSLRVHILESSKWMFTLFHVFCYLEQNEQNQHNDKVLNHLAMTKWLRLVFTSDGVGVVSVVVRAFMT